MKFPSFLFIFLLVWVIFSPISASAKNGWPACPENGQGVEIYMEKSMGDLRYHQGVSTGQLSRMSGNAGGRLGAGWSPSGLTVADENYRIRTKTKLYQLGRDRFCAVLKAAQLFIGYKKIDVYLTNKYRRGSCEYRSIMDHENVHVRIFRDTLQKHSAGIEQALRKYSNKIGPVYLRSPDAAANHLQSLLDAKVRPLFKRMSLEIKRRNSRIDTKSNYRREQKRCSNW